MSGGIAKIARNFQVTVPKYVRQAMKVKVGDLVSFEITEDGQTLITPVSMIHREQAYYWGPKWRKEIQKSEKELKSRSAKTFKTVGDLKKHLGDA